MKKSVFTKSRHGFLLQQYLDRTWCSTLHPSWLPRSVLLPPPHSALTPPQAPRHRSSAAKPPVLSLPPRQPRPHRRCTRTTTKTQRPPSTTRSTLSSTLSPSACPRLTILTTVMGLWRALPTVFFANLIRRGNMLETNEAAEQTRQLNLPSEG